MSKFDLILDKVFKISGIIVMVSCFFLYWFGSQESIERIEYSVTFYGVAILLKLYANKPKK